MGIFYSNFQTFETLLLSAGATSASGTFRISGSAQDMGDCMVTNAGPNHAFIGFGASAKGAVTAQVPTSTGALNATPILAGQTIVFNKNTMPMGADTIAAITAGGSTTLYATSGRGA